MRKNTFDDVLCGLPEILIGPLIIRMVISSMSLTIVVTHAIV